MHPRRYGYSPIIFLVGVGIFFVFFMFPVKQTPKDTHPDPLIVCEVGDDVDSAFEKTLKANETVYIPDVSFLETLRREELASLYHRYIENLQYLCKRRVRLGSIEDGGWDICDEARFRPKQPCLIYSFGINNDFTFDDAAAELYGCEVHSFDPSMEMSNQQRGALSYFYAWGISDTDEVTADKWPLFTFNSIRRKLRHDQRHIPIVKMDVETYEWRVVQDLLANADLSHTHNLVIEFHLELSSPEQDRTSYLKGLKVLKGLYDAGYRIFWTHQNKWCKFVSKCKRQLRTNCHEINFVRVNT